MELLDITGKKKAAILLNVLGAERSSFILQNFKEEEIEAIVKEMITEQTISGEVIDQVLKEAHIQMFGEEGSNIRNQLRTSLDYAKTLLSLSLGEIRSREMMERLGITEERIFDFITAEDIDELVAFLKKQLPQTIALVLLHLKRELAAKVLEELPDEIRTPVIIKASSIHKVDSETIATLKKTLEEQLRGASPSYKFSGTTETAEMLKRADANVKNEILENLDTIDQRLRDELERQMFRFEGLNLFDDEGLQVVLRSQEISTQDLAYALKSCLPRLKERILSNLPPTRREDVEYGIETMGRVRLWKVEQAQQHILEVVRKLVDQGEISLEEGEYVE